MIELYELFYLLKCDSTFVFKFGKFKVYLFKGGKFKVYFIKAAHLSFNEAIIFANFKQINFEFATFKQINFKFANFKHKCRIAFK